MALTPQEALQRVIDHHNLTHDEMRDLMRLIMSGGVSPVMMAALLTGLRVKGESLDEVTAAVEVMREFSAKVTVPAVPHFIDIVGTGGDGAHTFNISTAAAFVVAAAGGRVAKHGNRSVSSKSGSADVLEALGVNLMLTPERIAECVVRHGIGFMFAPNHHPAMKYVAPVRRELGVRTIFNILGPLTNPAGAPNLLVGVFHPNWVGLLVRVLQRLGADHVLVVHGQDGMDEITLGAGTMVGELKNGDIREYVVQPEDWGLARVAKDQLRVADVAESKALLLAVLDDTPGAARDIVMLNAGAALYAANRVDSIGAGIELARQVLASGAAKTKLSEFIAFTRQAAAQGA